MRCPNCGFENPPGTKVCGQCGAPLKLHCANCGFDNPPGFKFCGNCGQPLSAPSPALQPRHEPQAVSSAAQAERRQMTVMFCDLVGSTPLSGQLDPEDLREVIRAYQEICERTISRYEGHIAQYVGDGLLVYFGYPRAHEDDAQRAVRAGLGIVEGISSLNPRLQAERGIQLAVRLGIHTGLVVVGEMGAGETRDAMAIVGENANIAARVQATAETNSVVISAATYRLIQGFFDCKPLGARSLKGVSHPLELYQVLHESAARTRLDVQTIAGLIPLVGRKQELALLLEGWERAKDGGGQVVLLSGEAGIGKSRLVEVLKEQVAADPRAWLTPCQCSPFYQNSPLYPMIDLLQRVVLQFDQADSTEQKLSKLEGFLVQYGFPLPEMTPLFAALLSIPLDGRYPPLNFSPEQQKQMTLQTLLTVLLERAARQPLLFVVEDLHWMDPTSLEFLSLLVDQGPTTRILAIFTYRPDFDPPWSGRSHVLQLTLNRLTRQQVEGMVNEVTRGKTLPGEVLEQIVAKTDGVPLFVEELTKTILESGLLKERGDRYELAVMPLPPLAIPSTLQDSLMARLDRLATVKEIAQLAATLGREFSFPLLQAVASVDQQTLQWELGRLIAAELVYQRGVPPNATFLFKHALVQEAAYESQLKSKRQQVHQRIANILAERFPEIAERQPELLAHHFTEAGLKDKAITYWLKAGDTAAGLYHITEAREYYAKALATLSQLPDTLDNRRRRVDTLTKFVACSFVLETTENLARLAEAESLAKELPGPDGNAPDGLRLARVRYWIGRIHFFRGEMSEAIDFFSQVLGVAQEFGDQELVALPSSVIGRALAGQGQFGRAEAYLAEAVAPLEKVGNWYDWTITKGWLGVALAARGEYSKGLVEAKGAAARATEMNHPTAMGACHLLLAMVFLMGGDSLHMQESSRTAVQVAEPVGDRLWVYLGLGLQSWAESRLGQHEPATKHMAESRAVGSSLGGRVLLADWLAAADAEIAFNASHIERALALAEHAAALAQSGGGVFGEGLAQRTWGQALAALGRSRYDESESHMSESLRLLESGEGSLQAARTHVAWGKVLEARGNHDAARRHFEQAAAQYEASGLAQQWEETRGLIAVSE